MALVFSVAMRDDRDWTYSVDARVAVSFGEQFVLAEFEVNLAALPPDDEERGPRGVAEAEPHHSGSRWCSTTGCARSNCHTRCCSSVAFSASSFSRMRRRAM